MSKKLTKEQNNAAVAEIPYVFLGSSTPFKTHANSHLFPVQGEVNTMPSKTVPDLTFTVEELVTRFTQGKTVAGTFRELDEQETQLLPLSWDKMDLSEKHTWMVERQDEIRQALEKANAAKKAKDEADREAEINKRVEEKIRARRELKNPGQNPEKSAEGAQ